MATIKNITQKLNKLFVVEDKEEQKNKEEMVFVIEEAKKEWEEARHLLDYVEDPDLIDHAIYSIQAAEKKYVYLYKQAKFYKVLEGFSSLNK